MNTCLVATLILVAGGCGRSGSGNVEERDPATGPDVIWILDVPNPDAFDVMNREVERICTEPGGEPFRIRYWYGGREEGASVVVSAMRARAMPPAPDGSMATGMGFDSGDCLAYRVTGQDRDADVGRWREFRRLEGKEATEAIRGASAKR